MRLTTLLPLLLTAALTTARTPHHRRSSDPPAEYTLQFREGIRNTSAAHEHMDLITWSSDATHECLQTLTTTPPPPHPAGIALCYNIPALFLDEPTEDTRRFAVDMRLFQLSAPTGDWARADRAGFSLDVKYPAHIAAEPRNATAAEISAAAAAAAAFSPPPHAVAPTLLQSLPWIGTVADRIARENPGDQELRKLLTPEVALVARTRDGKELRAPVDVEAARFLLGVFSPPRPAPVAPPPEPFQMPGMAIEITPIGLYMYAAYLAVACGMFGYGTFERAMFRKEYRERMAQTVGMTGR